MENKFEVQLKIEEDGALLVSGLPEGREGKQWCHVELSIELIGRDGAVEHVESAGSGGWVTDGCVRFPAADERADGEHKEFSVEIFARWLELREELFEDMRLMGYDPDDMEWFVDDYADFLERTAGAQGRLSLSRRRK